MATLADISVDTRHFEQSGGLTAFIDRWIWVFMAALMALTVLTGFIPDSLAKVAAVEAGARPPFPPILHVHAVLMGSWMVLLLSQTTLMATGRSRWHMQLGILSVLLMPAIVIAGFILAPTMYRMVWAGAQAAGNVTLVHGVPKPLAITTNVALFQLRGGLGFAICATIGILARGRNSGLHKRMMILATSMPLSAAIFRIAWLPTTLPGNPLSLSLANALVVLPLFAWDLYRLRRIHSAYVIWLALFVPSTLAIQMLWNTPWWFATVPRLMGVH